MSAEPAGAGPAAPPVFRRELTVVTGVLVLVLAGVVLWPTPGLERLDRPEASLARLVGREMELRTALRDAPAWERRVHALLFGSEADARADALRWFDELVATAPSPIARLHQVVLAGETRGADAAAALLEAWEPGDARGRAWLTWARLAYGPGAGAPEALRAALAGVRAEAAPDWFADRLAARLAWRLGDRAAAAEADAAIRARGGALLAAHRALLVGQLLLSGLGVLLLRGSGAPGAGRGTAALPPPWGAADGAGLFTRGSLGLLAPAAMASVLLPDTPGTRSLVSLASAVPLLACLRVYARRRGVPVGEAFGLRLAGGRRAPLLRATAGLVGITTLADLVVETAGTRLGWAGHWTDGFQETLVWGALDEILADLLDSVVVVPVVEELLFRGVLYGTLRRGLAPLPAALASAAVFAVAHGYGAVGSAAVFASGVLWALAYERTRSLLPCVLAHAASNLLATLLVVATLRV
jgi:membrane protease YdiL (CAAX protease family)